MMFAAVLLVFFLGLGATAWTGHWVTAFIWTAGSSVGVMSLSFWYGFACGKEYESGRSRGASRSSADEEADSRPNPDPAD